MFCCYIKKFDEFSVPGVDSGDDGASGCDDNCRCGFK